jgi:hypothetical protein
MTTLLSIHPIGQLFAILVAIYAFYLGYQRTKSLHYNKPASFKREHHVVAGTFALISMLGGIAAGFIMVSRHLDNPEMGLHVAVAMVLLPLSIFGIFSGFFLYINPRKRKILPAFHGINNFLIIILALLQVFTGTAAYLRYVLKL